MIAIEPLGQSKLQELLSFAQCAYNTPTIGRALYSETKKAGFNDVRVKIIASADTKGRLLPVIKNFIGYAKVGGMEPNRADALLDDIQASVNAGTFMMVLPQFIVTAIK